MSLTAEQTQHLQNYRDEMNDRLDAYRMAAEDAARLVEGIQQHIAARNYGLAEDACAEALEALPHDYGAQTFHALFDKHYAERRAARAAREAARA